jgi:hypothetical protein
MADARNAKSDWKALHRSARHPAISPHQPRHLMLVGPDACWACAKIAYDLSTVMHIHEEINAYRDMIDAGKPRAAVALLTALRDRLPATVSDRIRFRILANIGTSHHRLGETGTY